jgi:type IV secretory pathway TrbD component
MSGRASSGVSPLSANPTAASTAMEVHPIHPSLVRPVLFAGAEPAAAVLEGLTAGALLFGVGFHVATIALALFYLTVVHGVMVWVAKQDPHMSQLYLRSLAARDFYYPHGSAGVATPPTRQAIPPMGSGS